MGIRLESDHATLAAQENLATSQDQLEAQDHPLRARLRANQRDAGARQKIELLLEILLFTGVRTREADRHGGTRIVGHDGDVTPL